MAKIDPLRIDVMPTRSFVGLMQTYGAEAPAKIPELWRRFAPHIGSIPGQAGHVAYGIIAHMRHQPFSFDYMAGVEVVSGSAPPPELQALNLPGTTYAVFAHEGHVTALKNTIDAIFNDWLPRSGRETAVEPHLLERYGDGFNPQTGEGDIEVWVALEP
ncbi:MAG: GyrI-like domain-containing protein [Alphaproteobacteria bacterium]